MRIITKNDNIIVEDVQDFDLSETLECGQCFRFDKVGENDYILVAMNRLLHVSQDGNNVTFHETDRSEYDRIWKNYFDMERDYGYIKNELKSKNGKISDAISSQGGIRILNQEFDEVLISFIISQNQRIPRIKKIIAAICEKYGDKVGEYGGKDYYSFPDRKTLANITKEQFHECKTGFRDQYLCGAAKAIASGEIDGSELKNMSREEAEKKLTSLKGVGNKVADCTLLFGLGFREAFPVDVWIKKIMEEIYFGKETKKETIRKFAADAFGEYGGYAQQYLFAYAREKASNKQ